MRCSEESGHVSRTTSNYDIGHDQDVYKRMCAHMHIMASNFFVRHLPTTEVIMKHSYLGAKGTKACCAALMVFLEIPVHVHVQGIFEVI